MLKSNKPFIKTTADLQEQIEFLSHQEPMQITDMCKILNPKASYCKYEKLKRTYLLNEFSMPKYTFRYMQFSHFKSFIKDKHICFVSPEIWQDPFERRFLKTDYSAFHYQQPQVACLCTTQNGSENEDASWKVYNDNSDKVLRVEIRVFDFLKLIDDFADKNDCDIFIGKMSYEFTRKQIENIHNLKDEYIYRQVFNKDFHTHNYLSLLCLKRKAFSYENEIRFFICKNNDLFKEEFLLKIPMNFTSIIESVTVGPLPPFKYGDPRYNSYKEFFEKDFQAYKAAITTLIPNMTVKKSKLYNTKTIEKIEYYG